MIKSVFYKIYFAVVFIFIIMLVGGLFFFNGFLKDYEANQPEKIVEALVDQHLRTNGILGLAEHHNLTISEYETEETVQRFYEENIAGKEISVLESFQRPENVDRVYRISADEKNILDLHLKKDKDGRFYVHKTQINPDFYKSYTISASADTEITVNGRSVLREHRKNKEIPDIVKKHRRSEKILNKQIIDIDNLLVKPSGVVAVSNGVKTELALNGNRYVAEHSFPERAEIEKHIYNGLSAYAAYMFNLAEIGDVAPYFDTSSDFYRNLRTTETHYTLEYVENGVEEFKIDDMHKYDDAVYSCHATFVNVLRRRGKVHKDYFDKYIYVKATDNGYKIIDIQNGD